MDPYRLPRTVVPSRYELRLEPDLDARTFDGDETITVAVVEPTSEIVLNAAELTIREATATNDRGDTAQGTVAADEAAERCRIVFPTRLAAGAWKLRLAFTGIPEMIGHCMDAYEANGAATVHTLDDVRAVDRWARDFAARPTRGVQSNV